jgi:hypothetical protein
MTVASLLIFPGGRTLASWWRQLASFRPQAFWTGHLLLHRVEALAALQLLAPLDPIYQFLLKALALTARGSLADLEQNLHLGLPLLRQLLRHLESEQLVLPEEEKIWSLTALGRQALEQGNYRQIRTERRAFYFVENEQSPKPPHFLSFRTPPVTLAWPIIDGWRFEPSHLQNCIARPVAWKHRFGFPLDVQQILGVEPGCDPPVLTAPAWQRVIFDRPERMVVAVVLAPAEDGHERLLGFLVQPEGWILQTAEPAFVVEADWQEVFPDLAVDPSLDQWRQAWRTWCQPRGLPVAEVDACVLERHGHRLRVLAASRLVERLRAARSDVFKGDAWLLGGTDRLRPAVQLELVEMKRDRLAGMPPRPSV